MIYIMFNLYYLNFPELLIEHLNEENRRTKYIYKKNRTSINIFVDFFAIFPCFSHKQTKIYFPEKLCKNNL